MKKIAIIFILFISLHSVFGQINNTVQYTLTHTLNSNKITIQLQFETMNASDVKLVIPRSAPGTYDLTNYIAYVDNVRAFTTSNKTIKGTIDDGSFFVFDDENSQVNSVEYEVDIQKMEKGLLGSFATSKMRKNYLGILGYSVFGFVEGLEEKAVSLKIVTDKDWPIFSTLNPSENRETGTARYTAKSFAWLVDGQYLLGSGVQIHKVKGAEIPLFVAAFSETDINIQEIGRRGLLALKGLSNYFDYVPMPHYTMCYEFLKPISERHDYGFSMEHLNSMTASFDTSRAVKEFNPKANIGSIVHHMGHSWVPLRSYGTGYRPFEWQVAPLVETIWLNEGFTWYIAYYNVLERKNILAFFNRVITSAPEYIQQKSLRKLSLLGSTQYSLDFRIGKNLFSRGALLARDLDVRIQEKTNGKKSFKDVMLGLLHWTALKQRPFTYEEIEGIISDAVGVDISDIWEKWQEPLKK